MINKQGDYSSLHFSLFIYAYQRKQIISAGHNWAMSGEECLAILFVNNIQSYRFYSYKPNLVSQYVVVELLLLTATGEASECINPDGFSKSVDVMKTQVIETFENVTFSLKDNECDANAFFDCFVTKETHDAFAAYLCYAI